MPAAPAPSQQPKSSKSHCQLQCMMFNHDTIAWRARQTMNRTPPRTSPHAAQRDCMDSSSIIRSVGLGSGRRSRATSGSSQPPISQLPQSAAERRARVRRRACCQCGGEASDRRGASWRRRRRSRSVQSESTEPGGTAAAVRLAVSLVARGAAESTAAAAPVRIA